MILCRFDETWSADLMPESLEKNIYLNRQVKHMSKKIEIKTEKLGRGGMTSDNFALPAGGIRRPHPRPDIGGTRVRECVVVI